MFVLHNNRKCFYLMLNNCQEIKEDLQCSYSIYSMGKGLNMRIFTVVFRHTLIYQGGCNGPLTERKCRQYFIKSSLFQPLQSLCGEVQVPHLRCWCHWQDVCITFLLSRDVQLQQQWRAYWSVETELFIHCKQREIQSNPVQLSVSGQYPTLDLMAKLHLSWAC